MAKEEVCSLCGGTGFIKTSDGKVDFCLCRFKEEDVNRILRIPKRFWNAEISNYEAMNPSEANALKDVMVFVTAFEPERGQGLTLIGPPGVGKTHLAVGILKEIYRRKGIKGVFFDTKDLIYKLKAFLEERKLGRAVRSILNKELLVLDDLGSEMLSEWQRELLSYIITYRYNNLKSTIITTNYELRKEHLDSRELKLTDRVPEETLVDKLGDSIVSRIEEMNKTVRIYGEDRRRFPQRKLLP